ncbi:MAG: hypothetical protein AAF694_17715 [Bacteroidota bacterium]
MKYINGFIQIILILGGLSLSMDALAQQVEHLGWQINTQYDEREPILSPDGRTLYFWRRLSPENTAGVNDHGDIWFTIQLGSGDWAPAKRMGIPLNTPGHDFIWQVSEDGDTLWMTQVPQGPYGRRNPGLAYATRSSYGGWNRPVPGRIEGLVSSGNCKDYFLTPEKILLLPNQGGDTYGASDLYVAFPVKQGMWSRPINLGPVINSYGDEDAPFLGADGKTLFFNSNGHGGLGDHDVFMSTRLDDSWTNWSEPVNLGAPVNTPGYDFDFRLSPDKAYAYWGSETGTQGEGDIFRIRINSCEVDVYPEGDQALCQGDSLRLEAGFAFFPTVEYQWYKDGIPLPGEIYRSLLVKEEGSYSLERKMGTCQVRSSPKRITLRTVPEIALSTPADYLCEGDSVLLWSGRREGYTYQWQMNGLDIYEAKSPGHWATGPGTYSLRMSNGECSFETQPVTLEQIPSPEVYISGDILPTSASSLPKWLWTNHAPYQKGEISLHDIEADNRGNSYVLYLRNENGKTYEDLLKYYSEGPVSFQESISSMAQAGRRFLEIDPRGNAVVARSYPYLSKYSSSGKLLWEINQDIGQISGVSSDAVGNIYTYGRFQRAIKIGDEVLTPANRGSIFLAKHSPNGELIWVQDFPVGGVAPRFGNSIHVDNWGNVFIAGSFNGIANFRESVLRAPIRGESFFIAKFDTRGIFHWANPVTVQDNPGNTQDFYSDPYGKSYILLGSELMSFSSEGTERYNYNLEYSFVPNRMRMVAQDDQVYIMGFAEKERMYFVQMVSSEGRLFTLWEGGKGEKGYPNQHVLGISPENEILVSGLSSGGELPSDPLSPGRNSRFFTSKFGRPKVRPVSKPLSLCDVSPIYLLSGEVKGVQYEWLKDGIAIQSGASNMLEVSEPGNYQVKLRGGSCENVSAVQQVVLDCEDGPYLPPSLPPVVAQTETRSEPEPLVEEVEPEPPVDPFEKDVPELERSSVGAPVMLNNRKVVSQGGVEIRNTTVTLSLWDHEVFDQDTVSLNINGEWVLEDYCLLPEKKELTYTFDRNNPNNFIILYAKNLGLKPPNTASLMIDDGVRKRTLRLRSTLEDCGTLEIKFNE